MAALTNQDGAWLSLLEQMVEPGEKEVAVLVPPEVLAGVVLQEVARAVRLEEAQAVRLEEAQVDLVVRLEARPESPVPLEALVAHRKNSPARALTVHLEARPQAPLPLETLVALQKSLPAREELAQLPLGDWEDPDLEAVLAQIQLGQQKMPTQYHSLFGPWPGRAEALALTAKP